MKRLVAASLVLCAAIPAFAGGRRADLSKKVSTAAPEGWQVQIVPNGREVALQTMARLRASASLRHGRIGTTAIVDNRSTRAIVIPAVGSVQGANNTFFRSDITLVNYNDTTQLTQFIFLPSGNPNGTIVAFGNLPGNRPPFTIADFVGTQLRASGLGALLILPVLNQQGVPDDNGAIDAFSRIYTPQPNTTRGTVSQPFPGVDLGHLASEYEGLILGLRQDGDFRTNVGLVNLSDVPLPFLVTIFPESAAVGTQVTQIPITLQPLSMIQQGLPATFGGNPGQINLDVSVNADIPNDDFAWTAYASTTDNFTGDGYVSIASIPLGDEDLDDRGQ